MPRTRIKICGVGRVQDALAAAGAGADAVGLVFHKPAGRYVKPEIAREILAALPPFVTPVALFVDASADEVRETARSFGIRHIQLHGHESPDVVAKLNDFVILKAIRVDRETFQKELADWRDAIARGGLHHLRGLILETAGPAPGGTGVANDWMYLRECQAAGVFRGLPPIIAAGGLTPENVADVIRDLHPWAVDVSSGVESTRGNKSAEKIEAFVREVSSAHGAEGMTP